MPELMRHAISEAAVAVDDVEGWWYQGRDLTEAEIYGLNERILNREATVVREGEPRWLITFGRGFTYLVEPIVRCADCRQIAWVDEVTFMAPVHTACYDPKAWA